MPAPFDPHTPTADQTLYAVTRQYGTDPTKSISAVLANPDPKLAKAEINSLGALLNPAYVRPP
jgi:hypothetical protein